MDIYHKTYALEIAKKYIHNKNHTELIDNLKAEIHKRIETTTSKSKKTTNILLLCIALSLVIIFFNSVIGFSLFGVFIGVFITSIYYYIRHQYFATVTPIDEVIEFNAIKDIRSCSEAKNIINLIENCTYTTNRGKYGVDLSLLYEVLDIIIEHEKLCNKFNNLRGG